MGVEVGQVVGEKYRLLRQIGEGGMGSVWAAVHLLLDRNVAIKFLPLASESERAKESSADAAEHFEREAKSAAKVSHRYVVDVFDFGVTDDGVHYMVQELLSGDELARVMDEGPGWEARDVVRFMAQCLTALDAVHRAGLVHRDIKPENIFVARDAEGPFPKLLDFGICHVRAHAAEPARAADRKDRKARGKHKRGRKTLPELAPVSSQPITQGTPAYMAPEQLRGLSNLDGRADLYSVAVTVYEWLTGRLPYEQLTPDALCAAIATRSALPLSELRPDLGEELSSVIMRALSPLAAERFDTAADMRGALLETLPKLGRGLAVVQKALAPAAIGSKTERILSAASCPFAEITPRAEEAPEGAPALPLVGFWRARGAYLAVAAAGLTMLGVAALPRTPAPFQQLDRAHASARAEQEPHTRAPSASMALLPTQASQTQPNAQAAPQPAPENAPVLLAAAAASTARTPAVESAAAGEPVVQPAPAQLAPRPVKPAQPKSRPTAAPAKVPAPEPAKQAPVAQAARVERVAGGFTITEQHVQPVEPVVEERPLTALDMRRLGL